MVINIRHTSKWIILNIIFVHQILLYLVFFDYSYDFKSKLFREHTVL